MIDSCCVEAACTAFDAVNLITFVQQKLSKVRTVLPSDARDQSFFGHGFARFHLSLYCFRGRDY